MSVWDRDLLPGQPVRFVRPYAVTRGRTVPRLRDLAFESQLVATAAGRGAPLRFELAEIVRRCDRPLAVVEVAAALDLPVGAARVLVADLVADGHLEVAHGAPVADERLLGRVLVGLQSL